jgi:hypothetical protein
MTDFARWPRDDLFGAAFGTCTIAVLEHHID